ncbi:phosphate ABC transporter permease [Litoribrevibacter albus]|uniref:Phosphate ABC transporter permease n=2 Tax=Litoribrevibacter albus TaxID=1473156 RepID=A0AA37SBA8_9GAMM|nr:phosphate ABC transporter permease [Litoribrevibacter albus]
MFKSASIEEVAEYPVPAFLLEEPGTRTVYLATEEQAEIGLRVTASGNAVFFDLKTGAIMEQVELLSDVGSEVSFVTEGRIGSRTVVLGLKNGQAFIFKHKYIAEYDKGGNRTLIPEIVFPYGEEAIDLLDEPIVSLAMNEDEENMVLAASGNSSTVQLVSFEKEADLFGEGFELERYDAPVFELSQRADFLVIDAEMDSLFAANRSGKMERFNIEDVDSVESFEPKRIIAKGESLTQFRPLLGGISVLVADTSGKTAQWFMARDESGERDFMQVRSFHAEDFSNTIDLVSVEERRKGFYTIDNTGVLNIYNTTAHRSLLEEQVIEGQANFMTVAPRADAFLIESNNMLKVWEVENKHPEVSWSSLWEEVWYENYDEPDYIWQSSAATNDFEPKMSLTPLAFGTIKAAFYAMLFAVPLAICGAIYTAYFMAPEWRRKVKPVIELMEALPTVIIGFLAGLFLAPFIETNLTGVFTLLLVLPLGILVFGFIWANLPKAIRHRVPDGWDAALLIPVLLFLVWLSMAVATPIEQLFFAGDMRTWISNDLGINFDQRNALVVGIAMGFAVIPSIFSIAEDAIFSVPKHLSHGSLALGATPWQTLVRVVMPTASPGIFSAVMIGMGRAVGETMIVLMATGNTPVMDWNIFEGMRTLSANIAVEVAESEVHSTHYRVLFLAAFVLFMFTFVVNTVAELIRQRLRNKYGSL